MRVDVVSIFPEYLAPLSLSLPGRARRSGLLDVHVHDLRDWTHDRHRTVDDTPYGGGAGMVMRPEPWGEALDALAAEGAPPVVVVPTPSGQRFDQTVAAELAGRSRLLFACGRYEGIDQRVIDHAAGRWEVRELSIGDYVLNGGEVAALAMIEAVVRLLPGFMGNPESLAEESHGGDGLLEYPVYTKPPSWRGLEVPEVLRSGDHARIEGWRREQAERRTALRRPDLLHPSRAVRAGDRDLTLRPAAPGDAGELLSLQRACYAGTRSADSGDTGAAAAVHEELADVIGWLPGWTTLLAHAGPRLVGAVRVRLLDQEWQIDRLMVVPDLRGRGLGGWLLAQAEATAPTVARRATLCAVTEGDDHQGRWRKAGYRPERGGSGAGPARLTKPLRRAR